MCITINVFVKCFLQNKRIEKRVEGVGSRVEKDVGEDGYESNAETCNAHTGLKLGKGFIS